MIAKDVRRVFAGPCPCDFCTGKKRWEDNWCPHCAQNRLESPKHWENLDKCEACEKGGDF